MLEYLGQVGIGRARTRQPIVLRRTSIHAIRR